MRNFSFYLVTLLGVFCAVSQVAPMSAHAQSVSDEDDLLGGLGGDDAPQKPAKPAPRIEDNALLDPIEEPKAESKKQQSQPAQVIKAQSAGNEIKVAKEAKPQKKKPKKIPKNLSDLDRIKAVQKKPMLKSLRFELTPSFGISLNDSFFNHLALGLSAVFYPHDNFGVGMHFDYFLAHPKTNNQEIVRRSQISVMGVVNLPELMTTFDLHWVPLYGKMSLFNTNIVHFDLYLIGGVGLAKTKGNTQPATAIGIGQRFLVNEWMAIRFELRDTIYNDLVIINGVSRSDVQNYVMLHFGVSFFLPPYFEYSGP